MTSKRKFGFLTLGWGTLLVYVLATEVAERWMETWDQYESLRAKEQMVLSPEAAAARKLELLDERSKLEAMFNASNTRTGRGQARVVQTIDAAAVASGVKVDALVPHQAKSDGAGQETTLSIDVSGPYHAIGLFVNRLENARLPVRVTKITIENALSRLRLTAKIEAIITISSVKQTS